MLPIPSAKIILPNGREAPIVKRRRTVYPSNGDTTMRCGECGSTDFTAHVKPTKLGAARVTNLICSLCSKIFELNTNGELGGSLTIQHTKDALHRENINERPDNE